MENKISAKTLITAFDAVYRSAGTDYRPHLESVFIEIERRGEKSVLIATSTNGHVVANYTEPLTHNLPDQKYLVNAGDARSAIEAMRGSLDKDSFICDECDKEYRKPEPIDKEYTLCRASEQLGIFDGEVLIAAMRLINEDFPNYRKAIPPRVERTFKDGLIGIQPKYLRLIGDCIKAAFPDSLGVYLEPIGQLEATVWSYSCADRTLVVVCMPVRPLDEGARPFTSSDSP